MTRNGDPRQPARAPRRIPKAAAALAFARALVDTLGDVTSAEFDAVRDAGHSDAEIVEIIGHVALNIFTNLIGKATKVAIDFPKVELTDLADGRIAATAPAGRAGLPAGRPIPAGGSETMGNRFAEIAFTDTVKAVQENHGSRRSYARMEGGDTTNNILGRGGGRFHWRARQLLHGHRQRDRLALCAAPGRAARASSACSTAATLGFADFRGNRQYVSVGNLETDNRVSLFFMDYANRRRLKLLGRTRHGGCGGPGRRSTAWWCRTTARPSSAAC